MVSNGGNLKENETNIQPERVVFSGVMEVVRNLPEIYEQIKDRNENMTCTNTLRMDWKSEDVVEVKEKYLLDICRFIDTFEDAEEITDFYSNLFAFGLEKNYSEYSYTLKAKETIEDIEYTVQIRMIPKYSINKIELYSKIAGCEMVENKSEYSYTSFGCVIK